MIETVTLRNPRVIEILIRETRQGVGRSPTETAENLILESAEHRRAQRGSIPFAQDSETARMDDDGAPPPSKEAKSPRNSAKTAPAA